MSWKDPLKNPPKEGEYCWIYMPMFPDKWRWDGIPDILTSRYENGKFNGYGDISGCVLYWHENRNSSIPSYIEDNLYVEH